MQRLLSCLLTLLCMLVAGAPCHAHPQGMSSVNRYAGVRLHAREVEVDYLIDFAELPAWTEIEALDDDHDGAVTASERDRYVAALVARVLPSLDVHVDGSRVTLRALGHGVEAPPGQQGISTLRVAVELRGAIPDAAGQRCTVRLRDTWMSDRSGWRELGAEDSPAGRVLRSSLPSGARAGAGLAYPEGPNAPRAAPLRQNEATFVFDRAGVAGASWGARLRRFVRRDGPSSDDPDGVRLAALARDPQRSLGFVLFALALAFALGAGHALTPGHGKTLVGAWLIGARGRVWHALVLAAVVAVTHTATVFALALLAFVVERSIGSEKLLRVLALTSGVLVVGVALSQLPTRLRRLRAPTSQDHDHDDDHDDDHDHDHDHAVPGALSLRGLVALGVSGGVVPCTGALVVLLAAIGVGRVGFGVALLVAFSLGLASVLAGIGVLFVLARARFERMSSDGRLFRLLPVLSSCAVLLLGAFMIVRALLR